MKRAGILAALLFLLCGCGKPQPAAPPLIEDSPPAGVESAPLPGCNAVEAIRADVPEAFLLIPMEDGVVLVSQAETQLMLTGYAGASHYEVSRLMLPGEVTREEAAFQVWKDAISYYDVQAGQRVVLNKKLQPICRIDVPEDCRGAPLLSRNLQLLYYCTEEAVRVLDRSTGISRVLKQTGAWEGELVGLWLEDTVLQLRFQDPHWGPQMVFLSAGTGRNLSAQVGGMDFTASDSHFYASFSRGVDINLVYGTPGGETKQLFPESRGDFIFLPSSHQAVSLIASGDTSTVTLYNLTTGVQQDRLRLPAGYQPQLFTATEDGTVWFLSRTDAGSFLCRWQPEPPPQEGICCTALYYSDQQPDAQGLEVCREEAVRIGESARLSIRIGADAAAIQPWNYHLTQEGQTHLITRELDLLEHVLSQFPAGFLTQLGSCCEQLHICLVRSITGTAESGDTGSFDSILFWEENQAYIAIAIGSGSEGALYNKLWHMMEILIYSRSNALDNWNVMNPGDFRYDYDYAANRTRQDHQFLQKRTRSFVDMFAMSYPKEDRARVFEYAMLPGQENLFQSPILQQKLRVICVGIREGFSLEAYPQALPWEQYLQKPLVPEP